MPPPSSPTDPHTLSAPETALRYQEPYVTDGVNRKLAGVIPRGIYRGFKLEPTGVADKVQLTADATHTDHLAVYETATGRSLTHRIAGDFVVTLDSGYRGTEVILALYATYVVGSTTAAVVRVYTPAQFAVAVEATEVLVLGHIDVPVSGIIAAADISGEGRVIAGLERTWTQLVPNPVFARTAMGWDRTVSAGTFSMSSTAGRTLAGQTAALLLTSTGTSAFTLGVRLGQPVQEDHMVHYRLYLRRLVSAGGGTLELVFYWRDKDGGTPTTTTVTLDAATTDAAPTALTGHVFPPSGADRLTTVELVGTGLVYGIAPALVLNSLELFAEPFGLAPTVNNGWTIANHTRYDLHDPTGSEALASARRELDVSSPPSSYLGGVISESLSDGTEVSVEAGRVVGGRAITAFDSPYNARFIGRIDTVDQQWALLFESVASANKGFRLYLLTATTGSDPKVCLVSNAGIVDDGGTPRWSKDVASNTATRIVLTGSRLEFQSRPALTGGNWDDTAWEDRGAFTVPIAADGGAVEADVVELGAQLLTAAHALVPRITALETSGEARSLMLQLAEVGVWVQPGTPDQLEFVVNATWDGTQWNLVSAGQAALRLRLQAGNVHLETKASGSGAWADGAWVASGHLALADGDSTLSLSAGRLAFTDTGAGLANTNIAANATPDKNTLYAPNIPKAWGSLVFDGSGGVTIEDGFNVASVAFYALHVTGITFARPLANAAYAVVFTPLSGYDDTVVTTSRSASEFSFVYRRGGVIQHLGFGGGPYIATTVMFVVYGRQS
jgi:hypothetical protein